MIVASFDKQAMAGVEKVLTDLGANIKIQMSAAVSKTAAKVRTQAARRLATELAAPIKILKKIVVKGKMNRKDRDSMASVIYLNPGHPIPLRYFGAKQYKKGKGGVTYRVSPSAGRRSIIRDAFIVDRFGGNVYRRKGKNRIPLEQQYGPAPGDVFESSGVIDLAVKTAETELPKQIQERVRFLTLKAQGKLK